MIETMINASNTAPIINYAILSAVVVVYMLLRNQFKMYSKQAGSDDKLVEELMAYVEHISDLTKDIAISMQIIEQIAHRQAEIQAIVNNVDSTLKVNTAEVCNLQRYCSIAESRIDNRFGTVAVKLGYLTHEQIDHIIKTQRRMKGADDIG